MKEEFSFVSDTIDGICLLRLEGYFNDEAAESIKEEVTYQLDVNQLSAFIINFQNCQTINSLALTILMILIEEVVDDNDGKISLACLDKTNHTTFEMMGLFIDAKYCETEKESLDYLLTTA